MACRKENYAQQDGQNGIHEGPKWLSAYQYAEVHNVIVSGTHFTSDSSMGTSCLTEHCAMRGARDTASRAQTTHVAAPPRPARRTDRLATFGMAATSKRSAAYYTILLIGMYTVK